MSISYADVVARIKQLAPLTDRDIAGASGVQPGTVGAWRRGTRAPRAASADRLLELSNIVERLTRVMAPPYIPVWLNKPIPALDNEKPLELIARDDYVRVSRELAGLESPGFT